MVRELQQGVRCDPDSTAILTAKLTAKPDKKRRSLGYCADESELPAVQKRTVEHAGKGVSASWQARESGVRIPDAPPRFAELKISNQCY
jgi:hypothetical protein